MARRIFSVTDPTKENSLYCILWQDLITGKLYSEDMTAIQYKIVIFEENFRKAGYNMVDIERYKQAVIEEEQENRKYDND